MKVNNFDSDLWATRQANKYVVLIAFQMNFVNLYSFAMFYSSGQKIVTKPNKCALNT